MQLTSIDKRILVTASYNEVSGELANNATYQGMIEGDEQSRAQAEAWAKAMADARTDSILASFERIDMSHPEAMAALQQAFPGSEVVNPNAGIVQQPSMPTAMPPMYQPMQPQAPTNVVPFMPPAMQPQMPQPQHPAMQSAGGGGGNNSDALWQDLLMNPANWRDQRMGKRNPNAPDYVHAWQKNAKGQDVGLWLHGRFGQPPQHILVQLQQMGRA